MAHLDSRHANNLELNNISIIEINIVSCWNLPVHFHISPETSLGEFLIQVVPVFQHHRQAPAETDLLQDQPHWGLFFKVILHLKRTTRHLLFCLRDLKRSLLLLISVCQFWWVEPSSNWHELANNRNHERKENEAFHTSDAWKHWCCITM